MEKPRPEQVKLVDSPDERKEVVYLLSRLSPVRRVSFLEWACRAARLPNSPHHPAVSRDVYDLVDLARWDSSASERLTVECCMDLYALSVQWMFDLERALLKLVEMVRYPLK